MTCIIYFIFRMLKKLHLSLSLSLSLSLRVCIQHCSKNSFFIFFTHTKTLRCFMMGKKSLIKQNNEISSLFTSTFLSTIYSIQENNISCSVMLYYFLRCRYSYKRKSFRRKEQRTDDLQLHNRSKKKSASVPL